jgi:hypothetical protein
MITRIVHFAIASFLSTLAFCGELSAKPLPPAIPEEVYAYARGLDSIRKNVHSDLNLEKLLALGRKAADVLVTPDVPGSADLLERLSEESFLEVTRKMEGFWVNRQETVYVDLILDSFSNLQESLAIGQASSFLKH